MDDLPAGQDAVLAEGTRVGNFQIRGLIGAGAMGQVYLAHDTVLGRRVALKLVRRSALEHEGAARFLEEARATASFNHPHIVTLYAVGEHDGRPYLALEYIDGESLRSRLWNGPLPLREALRCCRDVADAIAEAHRHGLVHADLKPDNIVLASDGRVRVVDFGLAKLARGAASAMSGTPAYMAPERWWGAPPAGAIDVWSLGVTLHEVVTGARPLPEERLSDLIFAEDAIELPTMPATPWAELVRDCLALDPQARPTAAEVLRRLTAILDPPTGDSREDARTAERLGDQVPTAMRTRRRPPGPPRDPGPGSAMATLIETATQIEPATQTDVGPRLHAAPRTEPWRHEAGANAERQPFEGRSEVMATLVHHGVGALAARTPVLVTVRGDAGIGKTRLAAALQRDLALAVPAARVIALAGNDPSAGEVDDTIRVLLQRLVRPSATPVAPEEMRARLHGEVGDAWPVVAQALGWIGREAPDLRPLTRAPGALRITLVEATSRLIRRAAEQQPLCIILDDAHLADATTLDALELATLERTGPAALWICALVRPSFDALRPSWGERAEQAEVIDLPPLPDAAAQELCRTLLHPAENLPAQLVELITARAEGNAMLLGELCRALKNEGIIRQERTGAWILETDRVDTWPRTPRLAWLAERELNRLPPELALQAQLAALIGPRFTVTDIVEITNRLASRSAIEPAVAIERLEGAQLLRVRGRTCEFRNAMLCEALRAAVPEGLRKELHHAAFLYYRDLRRVPEERRRPRIAYHAAEAGLREPAALAYQAMADEYLHRHRYVEAEGAFSHMLALVDGAAMRQIALHGRGLARYRTGRYEDALDDLHQAHGLATELGDQRARLAILLDEATVLDWLQNYHRSAELVEQAAALAEHEAPEPVIAARVAMSRGRALWRLGKPVDARGYLLDAVGRAEAAGPAAYESLVVSLLMLGAVLSDLGEIQEAREVLDRVLALARAQGDRLHEIAALNNRSRAWIAEKDVERAAADLHAVLELGRTLGLVLVELVGAYNLGELLYQAGVADAAWPHVEHAVELAARRADLLPRPLARLLELRLLVFEERWPEARALAAEIEARHRAALAEGRSDAALLPSEELLLAAIRLAISGGGAAAEWDVLRTRAAREAVEQQPIEVIELQALGSLRVGDRAGARRVLGEAIEVARRLPNVMEARLLLRLSQIDASARCC